MVCLCAVRRVVLAGCSVCCVWCGVLCGVACCVLYATIYVFAVVLCAVCVCACFMFAWGRLLLPPFPKTTHGFGRRCVRPFSGNRDEPPPDSWTFNTTPTPTRNSSGNKQLQPIPSYIIIRPHICVFFAPPPRSPCFALPPSNLVARCDGSIGSLGRTLVVCISRLKLLGTMCRR